MTLSFDDPEMANTESISISVRKILKTIPWILSFNKKGQRNNNAKITENRTQLLIIT